MFKLSKKTVRSFGFLGAPGAFVLGKGINNSTGSWSGTGEGAGVGVCMVLAAFHACNPHRNRQKHENCSKTLFFKHKMLSKSALKNHFYTH